MKKLYVTFGIVMLAVTVGVFGSDGPPSVSAQTNSNSAATGAPTISGTAQVGQTLTVSTSGIADADGLSGVSFSYQWLADDADIAGATESSYTLVLANLTKTIKVRVSFIDNADNAETLTSEAVGPVDHRGGQQPNGSETGEQLIAVFSNVPASHDGSELRFNLTFTPEPSLSYATLRDHAFSIVGGTIIKANRTTAGEAEWVIMVVPDLDSNENPAGPITAVLPPTTSCIVLSAICTADDVPLSNRTEVTIPVSNGWAEPAGQAARRHRDAGSGHRRDDVELDGGPGGQRSGGGRARLSRAIQLRWRNRDSPARRQLPVIQDRGNRQEHNLPAQCGRPQRRRLRAGCMGRERQHRSPADEPA